MIRYLIVRQYVHDTNGTFRNGVVLVIHSLDYLVKMPKRRNLISQLRLGTEQAHSCCGNGF